MPNHLRRLSVLVFAGALIATLTPVAATAASVTVTLPVIADTELRSSAADTNFGSITQLYLGNSAGAGGSVIIRSPVWALPRGIIVDKAELQFTVSGWSDFVGMARPITAYRLTTPWHERLATRNNAPAAAAAVGMVQVGTPAVPARLSLDLTPLVRGWYTGEFRDYGLRLAMAEDIPGVYRRINSRETTTGPQLVVSYHAAPAPVIQMTPSDLHFQQTDSEGAETQKITLRNDGEQSLEWEISSRPSWLTVSPGKGSVASGESTSTETSVVTDGLRLGQHTGSVTYTAIASDLRSTQAHVTASFSYTASVPPIVPWSYLPIAKGNDSALPRVAPLATDGSFIGLYIGLSQYRFLPSPNVGPHIGDVGRGDPIYNSLGDARTFAMTIGPPDLPISPSVLAGAAPPTAASWFAGAGVWRQHLPEDFLWPVSSPVPPPAINRLVITTDGVGPAAGPPRTLPIDAAGTLQGLRTAFAWLAAQETVDTTAVLTFSGHGARVPDDNGDEADGLDEALVPVDSAITGSEVTQILRDDELGTLLSTLESQRVVVILDSCFAGGLDDAAAAEGSPSGLRPRGFVGTWPPLVQETANPLAEASSPGRIILSASRADEVSWESDELHQGVFSYFLLQGLMDPAADTDQDGWVAAEEAFVYAAPRVDAYVFALTGEHQHPQMYDGVVGNVNLTRP